MLMIKHVIKLTLLICLTSCSTMRNSNFTCSYVNGEGCKSISKINTMTDRGNLKAEESSIRVWRAPEGEFEEGSFDFIDIEETKE